LRLLRAIRLDTSDERVFPAAAGEGEWLVTGSPLWAGVDPETLDPKVRLAFAQGFLGIASFGFASLAAAGPIDPAELDRLRSLLADRLVERAGAPDRTTALAAAVELLEDALALARDLAPGALLAIERRVDPVTGELRERIRRLEAPPGVHARVFEFVAQPEVPEPGNPDPDGTAGEESAPRIEGEGGKR
jgi:hypothetical protein